MSSPRPESNRQPSLYESAALPLCYEGDLEQTRGIEPPISALATPRSTVEPRLQKDPSRVSSAELGTSSTSHRCHGDHVRSPAGLSVPLYIVEVRGIEPPVPASQTPCLTVRPHLEIELVPPVRLELTTLRVRTECSALELRRRSGGEGRSRTDFACRHATDATRARRVLLSVVCLIHIQVPHRGASSPRRI